MSGFLALIREVVGGYLAATGNPLSGSRGLEVFGYTARAAFVLSLTVVWFAEHRRLAATEAASSG
jgi:hypothetical protein